MRTFQEVAELAAYKDNLYDRWKAAGREARSLGQECHRLVTALDEAKAKRSGLEPASQTAWDAHNEEQAKISEYIKHYDSVGNDNAAQMREYFTRASTAFSDGDKAGAKALSITGHDFESKAKEANASKDYWIKRSQEMRQALLNSPAEAELRNIRAAITRLQNEFNEKNACRIQAKKESETLEKEFQQAKDAYRAADSEPKIAFTDTMSEGIVLHKQIRLASTRKQYPDYLVVKKIIPLTLEGKCNPAHLFANCAYIYNDNLYVTDGKGNIAYIDCEMKHTADAAAIRKTHKEYKSVGGANASHEDMDAGHFGISLGQHPSIAMEQDRVMNRYGAWRKFEQAWYNLSQKGRAVNIKAVFVEGDDDGTYAPFWCIMETLDGKEISEYNLTNDDTQS